jgi:hypothetical protein
MSDPNEVVSRLTTLGHEWADKESAAALLEETRKSLRSQIALKFLADTGAANKAEMMAEATDEYTAHVKSMVEARRLANIADVNYSAARIWVDLIRTKEATKRAEMGMR